MTIYRDNYPNNIEAPQKLYIQYSHDISFDYSIGKYPDGTEPSWDWESAYIPIKHKINGREVGRHEWIRIKIGNSSAWTYPIRISATITNISAVSSEIIIEEEDYTEFSIILTFEDGSKVTSEPITIRNGTNGIEIVSAEISNAGRLIITYSDGRVEDAGQARGQDAVGLPPAQDDDYILSQSAGVPVWISATQVIANVLFATLPIEYNFMTGMLTHSDVDGYRHVPIGGSNGYILSTDGSGNYTWLDPTELDPTVPQWVKDITETDISNWDTAYSWGDHSLVGYLTVETDPVYLASEAFNITATDITNLSNLSGINTGDQIADGITITGAGILGDPFTVDSNLLNSKMDVDGLNSNITSLVFNTSPTGITNTVGKLYWNEDEKTLSFGVTGGSIEIGKEQFAYFTNLSGGDLVEKDIVSVVGVSGNRVAVDLTDATDTISARAAIGMVTEGGANNNEVRVTLFGTVNAIDTSGFTEGLMVYVDPNNPGKLTQTEPQAPNYSVKVGIVEVTHAVNGRICTKTSVNDKLTDLADVNGTALTTTGQIPVWQNSTNVFDFTHNIDDYLPLARIDEAKTLTGFIDNSAITVAYDWATRTITLTGDLRYQWRGRLKELTSPWTSSAHSNTINTTYYLYTSDGDNFTWSTIPWGFSDVMMSLVRYRSTAAQTFALREVHGLMDEETHNELHSQLGTYRVSGLNAAAGTYILNTATDAANSPGFDVGVIKDEDLKTTIAALAEGSYTHFYVGPTDSSVFTLVNALPFTAAGSYMQINDVVTGTLAAGINNRYYNVYQLCIPVTSDSNSQAFKMVFIQPQNEHTTLAAAQSEDVRGLSLGDLGGTIPEYITYSRLTYKTASGDGNTGKCRLVSVTYVVGNRAGQVTVSGFIPTSHDSLSSATLIWASSAHTGTANTIPMFNTSGVAVNYSDTFETLIALELKDTNISARISVADFNIPEDCTFIGAFVTVSTAPTDASAIWDINITGIGSILTDKITIETGELSSLDAATQPSFSTTVGTKGQQGTVDCDQPGATIAGQNPILTIIWRKR